MGRRCGWPSGLACAAVIGLVPPAVRAGEPPAAAADTTSADASVEAEGGLAQICQIDPSACGPISLPTAPHDSPPTNGVSLTFGVGASYVRVRELVLRANGASSGPAQLRDAELRLGGDGRAFGGNARLHLDVEHLRAGLELGGYLVDGPTLAAPALAQGYRADYDGRALDLEMGSFFGASTDTGHIMPYLDLCLTGHIVRAGVGLRGPRAEDLGGATYHGFAASFGPRLGVVFAAEDGLVADLSAQAALVGDVARFGVNLGLALFEGQRFVSAEDAQNQVYAVSRGDGRSAFE